jgi:hypothetical protein
MSWLLPSVLRDSIETMGLPIKPYKEEGISLGIKGLPEQMPRSLN